MPISWRERYIIVFLTPSAAAAAAVVVCTELRSSLSNLVRYFTDINGNWKVNYRPQKEHHKYCVLCLVDNSIHSFALVKLILLILTKVSGKEVLEKL